MRAAPGGTPVVAGLLAGMAAACAVQPSPGIATASAVAAAAFTIGNVDGLCAMGGRFKPVGLALCSAPLWALGAHGAPGEAMATASTSAAATSPLRPSV